MSGSSPSLGTRTLRGMFWAYGSFAGVRLASFLTTAVLARVLAPRDFGVIALAMTFMAFLDMLQGLGVGQALVVADAAQVAQEADSAFALSAGMGVVLCLLAVALGPVAAATFHEHRLVFILPALGVTFLLYGLGSTHYALAMREINFRSRTAAEIADAVVRGVVGVGLAFAGAGVWSLVAGYVAGSLAMTVALWRLVDWRPRCSLRRVHVRRLLGFGGALTGVAIMGALLAQFDNAVVGRVLGSTELGFYSVANRLPVSVHHQPRLGHRPGALPRLRLSGPRGPQPRLRDRAALYGDGRLPPRDRADRARAADHARRVRRPLGPRGRGHSGVVPVGAHVPGQHGVRQCVQGPGSGRAAARPRRAPGRGAHRRVARARAPGDRRRGLGPGHHCDRRPGPDAVAGLPDDRVPVRRALAAMAGPALACAGLAGVLLGVTHVLSNPWLAVLVGAGVGGVAYLALLRVLARDLLDRLGAMVRPGPPPAGHGAAA